MSRPSGLNIDLYLRKSRKDIEEEKKASEPEKITIHSNATAALFSPSQRKNAITSLNMYEEVVSGESVTERPRIQEIIRKLDDGHADGVLVMDLDRLGRGDMLDQGLLDRAFRYSGTKISRRPKCMIRNPKPGSWYSESNRWSPAKN
jgi:site-specific DNA recombinase